MPPSAGRTRIGIVGCGAFGLLHARCWARVEGAAPIAFHDREPARAVALAAEFGGGAFETVSELVSEVDAVSIAVPPQAQKCVALECLHHGVHVLLEKPFCVEARQARLLASVARERGLVLQAGYVERFHPALALVSQEIPRPAVMTARRIQRRRRRTFEEDPILGLMVHDIDHAISFADSSDLAVTVLARRRSSPAEETIRVKLTFECGFVADLCAGYSERQNLRELRFVDGSKNRVNVDLQSRLMETPGGTRAIPDNNALRDQFHAFTTSVTDGSPAAVSATDAARILDVSQQVMRLLDAGRENSECAGHVV